MYKLQAVDLAWIPEVSEDLTEHPAAMIAVILTAGVIAALCILAWRFGPALHEIIKNHSGKGGNGGARESPAAPEESAVLRIEAEFEKRLAFMNTAEENYEKYGREINGIKEKLDKNREEFHEAINGVAASVLLSVIYNENIPVLERMEAARDYFKTGKNGNTEAFALGSLIAPPGKDNFSLWESVASKGAGQEENGCYRKTLERIRAEVKRIKGGAAYENGKRGG